MTIGEFKAFVDGIGVEDGDAPTVQQWKRIVEKLDSVKKEVIRETVPLKRPDDLGILMPPYTVT